MIFNRKPKTEIIAGLDIGSSAIRVAVGHFSIDDSGKSKLHIIGAAEAPSAGVHRGIVTSIEEVISSLSQALEEIERLIGVPIKHSWVGITSPDVVAQPSRGVISVAKADGEISSADVTRVIDAARTIAVPLNYDILHVIPRSFTVDGQPGVRDPVGMTGLRLEVDTQIIHGANSHLKNITKAVYRTGIDIDDVVLSILATGAAVTTVQQRELGVAVINIGGATTSVVVYEQGDVIHTAVIPIGSEHITNDLAIGLRTPIDVAEKVKLSYGHCVAKAVPKKEKISLSELGGEEETVSLHFVAEIIEARVLEILENVEKELIVVKRQGLLPAGIVCTGGGSKLSGLIDLTKHTLRLPATLGYPIDIPSVSHYSNDLSFAPAIGLVKWGIGTDISTSTAAGSGKSTVGLVLKQVKKVGQWLMP
jgi:cell division protein FtsA